MRRRPPLMVVQRPTMEGRAVSAGRDAEFTEYVSPRLPSLRRLAMLLCQDWPRADDLVQAALTKLYVHWGRARRAAHPGPSAGAAPARRGGAGPGGSTPEGRGRCLTMLESQVRGVLEQRAGGEPPPSRVDIGLARSRGRGLLRWRRAGLAGAPLLAAAAVAGVIVAAGAVGGAPRGAGGPAAGGSHGGATGRFNPLVRYASFGWLPPGQSVWSGGTGRTPMYLNAGPKPGIADWPLTVV